MISISAGLLLQVMGPAALPPAPPPRPPAGRSAPARAKANLGALISSHDYPAEALRKREEGTVGFRLRIGADGSVASCTVTQPSGSASLDETTCRIIAARARFTPARDRNGKPTTDSVSARIVWRIEDRFEPSPFVPTLAVATIRATPDGKATCHSAENGELPMVEICDADIAGSISGAARATGRPLEQTMVMTLTPAGGVEPTDREPRGILLLESEAALDIGADGSITECRVTRSKLAVPGTPTRDPPSACEPFEPGAGQMFEPAAESTGPRRATVKMRLYRGS